MSREMDSGILDELIKLCEDKMVHPLRKKAPAAAVLEVDAEPAGHDEHGEGGDGSDIDLEELMEAYKAAKGMD